MSAGFLPYLGVFDPGRLPIHFRDDSDAFWLLDWQMEEALDAPTHLPCGSHWAMDGGDHVLAGCMVYQWELL